MLPQLVDLLAANGVLLLSGILESEEKTMRDAIAEYPVAVTDVRQEGEWILIETRKDNG